MIEWQWSSFEALGKNDLYAFVVTRQQVFIIEQQCVYADLDGIDPRAFHLLGWQNHGEDRSLVAYLRCVCPGVTYPEMSLGRVLSVKSVRGTGIGRELVTQGIEHAERQFPAARIRIGAQAHLESFYSSFGFERTSDPYDEDGISHVEMLR
jgi:ElaA protein